jgi:serine/threonine-protein kinase
VRRAKVRAAGTSTLAAARRRTARAQRAALHGAVPAGRGPRAAGEDPSGARRFGPYVIRRGRGRGGAGVVYLAARSPVAPAVALKILLSPDFASRETRHRFYREARAAASLHHPNIVKVHEIAEVAGCPYFTMEAITGATLGDWLREARAPLERAVAVMRKVCLAVDYAHARGIVHRDLKPGNIVVDARGEPHIMDFGLAKSVSAAADESFATLTGTVLGTPHYMSPEQAAGEVARVDARTDIYAIGVMLYEIAAGDVPFRADSFTGLLDKIARAEPPPLRERRGGVAQELEAVIARAMAKDPARRFASAGALAEALARCPLEPPAAQPEPAGARPLERARGFVARHRLAAAALLTSALALACVVAAH